MIKAASHLLCLGIVFAIAAPLPSRADGANDDVNRAAEEAVRRQADTITMTQKLAAAQLAQQRGELQSAARLYADSFDLVQKIGPISIPEQTRQIVIGLSSVLLELAREDQKREDYAAADDKIRRVVRLDPTNMFARDMLRDNQIKLEAQEGHIPSKEVTDRLGEFHTNEIHIATLVQDGKLLFEAGKMDDAEVKFQQAYQADPRNVAAYTYLEMIQEKRSADSSRKADLDSRVGLLQVENAWDVPLRGEQKQSPNMFARTNLVYTSKGRQEIISKLDRIRIDSIKYDGLPLGEVINTLEDLAKSRDPDKTGVNFEIDRQTPQAAPAAAGAVDPATGLPVAAAAPAQAVDLGNDVIIKISPALNDVRLADVLDAITKGASQPISFSIEDYAVMFSLKRPEAEPLYTRVFHIDPNTFRQGLEAVSGVAFAAANITTSTGSGGGGGGSTGGNSGSGGGGNSGGVGTIIPQVLVAGGGTGGNGGGGGGGGGGGAGGAGGIGISSVTRTNGIEAVQALARQFFIAAGVDLTPGNGKAIFFNDRKGTLMVHASAADLDLIAAAVETLNVAPPEVNVKSKFIELTQNDNKALGFNWTLGGVNLGGGQVIASGGTQPSLTSPATVANPATYGPLGGLSTFPGSIIPGTADGLVAPANTTSPVSSSDGSITGGLRNLLNAPTVASFTGILTDPQFKVAINALEQRDGVDLLQAPEVTTESGRQAEIQAIDIQTIVTSTGITALGSTATPSAGTGAVVNNSAGAASVPGTTVIPLGPVLDVIPWVSADEYSVQMTIIPTVTEFLGYDNPGQFVPQALVSAGTAQSTPLTAVLPLPHFRLRQVVTSAIVWDAQTIVIGGLITDSVSNVKDKVPLLGDMPFVGRLFRSESTSKTKKNLLIFVTPTIINPDGTRYHSDEEMPFAQGGIPAQPQKPVSQ